VKTQGAEFGAREGGGTLAAIGITRHHLGTEAMEGPYVEMSAAVGEVEAIVPEQGDNLSENELHLCVSGNTLNESQDLQHRATVADQIGGTTALELQAGIGARVLARFISW
jgi:hypothetical protein